jgi:DNA-binding CsgD family transcriptional regulator
MTHVREMTEERVRSAHVPRSVGAAAESVLRARGDTGRLERVFEESHVPMVIIDAARRHVEVNRPARLAFRLSVDEMRSSTVDDPTAAELIKALEPAWGRLLNTGYVAGRHQVAAPDGSRLDIVYYGLAHVMPGRHLIAFVPADWPEDELGAIEDDSVDAGAALTRREVQLLALAAEGHSGPELAEALVLSPATVKTHFKNIHSKLEVRTRAAAVAKAMRLGIID